MVVIDALKYRHNRGKRSNLYFRRNAKGNEIDLLVESGPEVTPVEIKSAATINSEFFKVLRTFSSRLPSPPRKTALIYGGSEQQQEMMDSIG